MLPQDETFLGAYSLAGLYERLRVDAALHPDTMDQRFGGYAQLLALFRMVHDGARAGAMRLPPRHGALFDPDRYRFLEGRGEGVARQIGERIDPPLVPDGTIYRVLEKLIVLDGERISYRALDVEHVGSVYETMMGFHLETAEGLTVAIRAAKKQGAPAAVNLNALLDQLPATRAKWLQERTDRKLTDKLWRATRDAGTMEVLHAALDPVIDRNATPDLVPGGAMVLQPSEERRRSGSHYTPRELTEPIVRTALAPIFDRLRAEAGGPLHPEQILDLKICDPAMGSGAFLVEACRQLGDALVEAWQAHDTVPEIPPDENEIIFARRQVAQRCLYGVDRNPKAADLAKLSLWLVTLAKDHPLTFLDHALRPGDALVGLSRRQLETFHWKDDAKPFQDAYGWTDIPTDCEFLLDYEIDKEERGTRKRPYRYRWPGDVREQPELPLRQLLRRGPKAPRQQQPHLLLLLQLLDARIALLDRRFVACDRRRALFEQRVALGNLRFELLHPRSQRGGLFERCGAGRGGHGRESKAFPSAL